MIDIRPTELPAPRALRLYSALDFHPIAPYVFNPIEGMLFLGVQLCAARQSSVKPG